MKTINIKEKFSNKIQDCHTNNAIFNTKKYILLEDAIEITKEICNEVVDMCIKSAETKAYIKSNNKGSKYSVWKEGELIDLFNTIQKYTVDKNSILKIKNRIL